MVTVFWRPLIDSVHWRSPKYYRAPPTPAPKCKMCARAWDKI